MRQATDAIGPVKMKHGGLTDGAGQLKMAADKLEEAWVDAGTNWDDVVSRSIEEEQLKPLLERLKSALDTITRIGVSLNAACRDCADERQS